MKGPSGADEAQRHDCHEFALEQSVEERQGESEARRDPLQRQLEGFPS